MTEAEKAEEDRQKWRLFLDKYSGRLEEESLDYAKRKEVMDGVNPNFVLRNWIAQDAIEVSISPAPPPPPPPDPLHIT